MLNYNKNKIYYFMQLMWNWFSMNDREAVQSDTFFDSEHPNVTQMWYGNYILIMCTRLLPIAHH